MLGRNSVFTVMDSCRYDSALRASASNTDRIEMGDKRYSYMTQNRSSHSALTRHANADPYAQGISASVVYEKDASRRVNDLSMQTSSSDSYRSESVGDAWRQEAACQSEDVWAFSLSIAGNRYVDEYGLAADHSHLADMAEEIGCADQACGLDFLDLGDSLRPYPRDGWEMAHTSRRFAEDVGVCGAFGDGPLVHQQVMEASFIEGRRI